MAAGRGAIIFFLNISQLNPLLKRSRMLSSRYSRNKNGKGIAIVVSITG